MDDIIISTAPRKWDGEQVTKTMEDTKNVVRSRLMHRHKSHRKLKEFLCCAPALVLIVILNYYPLAELFRYSFTDWNMLRTDYQYVGLTNWEWFFQNAAGNRFFQSLGITFCYAAGSMAVTIVGGVLLALLFNRMNKLFSFMRAAVFLPKYVAMSTSAMIFLFLMNENFGVINYMLGQLGLEKVKWLTDGKIALLSLIILTAWHTVGYAMMIYLSSMQGISKEYYESASMEGASKWQQFRYITVPLVAPTTLFLFVTQFITAMKVYQSVDVLTGGGPYYSTEVIVYLIYNLAFVDYRMDRAAVVSTVFFLMVFGLTILTLKWSNRTVNYDV